MAESFEMENHLEKMKSDIEDSNNVTVKYFVLLLPHLPTKERDVREQTIVALSHLLTSCNKEVYNEVIDHLIQKLETAQNQALINTSIQCLASICRQSGYGLCKYMDRIMKLVKQFQNTNDDEVHEYCSQLCEVFVQRHPEAIKLHIQFILDLSLSYIDYKRKTDSSSTHINIENDGDSTRKIHCSAIKCLKAVISTRTDLVKDFYQEVSSCLVERFEEPEEDVRLDIFHAYIALLRVTKQHDNISSTKQASSPIQFLQEQVPNIVRKISPLMCDESVKTRQDCFLLLRELLNALPGAFTHDFDQLMPGIQHSLSDENSTSNMKIDALNFICCVLATQSPSVFHPHISTLVPLLISSEADSNDNNITIGVLDVFQYMVKVIGPVKQFRTLEDDDLSQYVHKIYQFTLQKLRLQEVDQEVKKRAIISLGETIPNLNLGLIRTSDDCDQEFLQCLRNEVTRLSAVEALYKSLPKLIQLVTIPAIFLHDIIPLLASFLRMNQHLLKLNSLCLLDGLVNTYGIFFESYLLKDALDEIPQLLSEDDPKVAEKSIILLTSIARFKFQELAKTHHLILPKVLLRENTLDSTLELFKTLASVQLPGLGYRQLADSLRTLVLNQSPTQPLHKHAIHSIAKCVADITLKSKDEAILLATEMISNIGTEIDDTKVIFYLLILGEIGRNFDLKLVETWPELKIDAFYLSSEEVKSAAGQAFGAIAVGNVNHFLPYILNGDPSNKVVQEAFNEFMLNQPENSLAYVRQFWNPSGVKSVSPPSKTRRLICELVMALTNIKPVNKTDAMTLLQNYGSLKNIILTNEENLAMCSGLGPRKAKRLINVFNDPFLRK